MGQSARSYTGEDLPALFTHDFLIKVMGSVFSCISRNSTNNQYLIAASESQPIIISIFVARIHNRGRITNDNTKASNYKLNYRIFSVPNSILIVCNKNSEETIDQELEEEIHEEGCAALMTIG